MVTEKKNMQQQYFKLNANSFQPPFNNNFAAVAHQNNKKKGQISVLYTSKRP